MIYNDTITGLLNSLRDSRCSKCGHKDRFKPFVQNQNTNPYYLNETLVKINGEGNRHLEYGNPNCLYKIKIWRNL